MRIEGLGDHDLLRSLTEAEQDAVAALVQERIVPDGEVLVAQGAPSTGLHLLLDGHAQVRVRLGDEEHDVALLGPGAVVGELALVEAAPTAAADVTAVGDVRAAVVPPEAAEELLAIDAVALQLDAIARRRRATNRALRVPPVDAGFVDDRRLVLRPLWPEDWRHLAAGTGRVSDESLRMRFFHVPPLTERTFRRLTTTDHADQFAWGAFVGGDLVGVGRHALQSEDRRVAELALLVADEVQGRGVGARLAVAVAAAADAHGARDLYALARADNLAVQRLLERSGASFQPGSEQGTVTARWPVRTALAAATDRRLVQHAHGIATAVLGDVLDR